MGELREVRKGGGKGKMGEGGGLGEGMGRKGVACGWGRL